MVNEARDFSIPSSGCPRFIQVAVVGQYLLRRVAVLEACGLEAFNLFGREGGAAHWRWFLKRAKAVAPMSCVARRSPNRPRRTCAPCISCRVVILRLQM